MVKDSLAKNVLNKLKLADNTSFEDIGHAIKDLTQDLDGASKKDLMKIAACIAGSVALSAAFLEFATGSSVGIGGSGLFLSHGVTFMKHFLGVLFTMYIYRLLQKVAGGSDNIYDILHNGMDRVHRDRQREDEADDFNFDVFR